VNLEEMLRDRFPLDAIEPVAKGELGADLVQRVNATIGSAAGIILWQLKRTKSWSVPARFDKEWRKKVLALVSVGA
jgi:hypothetical protein